MPTTGTFFSFYPLSIDHSKHPALSSLLLPTVCFLLAATYYLRPSTFLTRHQRLPLLTSYFSLLTSSFSHTHRLSIFLHIYFKELSIPFRFFGVFQKHLDRFFGVRMDDHAFNQFRHDGDY